MDEGRKAWRKLEGFKGLHDERERREKEERRESISLGEKIKLVYKWGPNLFK